MCRKFFSLNNLLSTIGNFKSLDFRDVAALNQDPKSPFNLIVLSKSIKIYVEVYVYVPPRKCHCYIWTKSLYRGEIYR